MKTIDVRITKENTTEIASVIGKKLVKYRAEMMHFSNCAFETIGLFFDDKVFALTNSQYVVDYFGAEEEIVLLKIEETTEPELPVIAGNLNMIDIPIDRKIKEIHIIQENQKLYEVGELTYDVYLTRGIIFVMDDGYEVSFEKDNPFVERIAICRGENLIEKFSPKENATDDLRPNQTMMVERKIQILS